MSSTLAGLRPEFYCGLLNFGWCTKMDASLHRDTEWDQCRLGRGAEPRVPVRRFTCSTLPVSRKGDEVTLVPAQSVCDLGLAAPLGRRLTAGAAGDGSREGQSP